MAVQKRAPTIHYVDVGKDNNQYEPDSIVANVGDILTFRFYPTNHTVVRAEYKFSCIPYEDTGEGKVGFYSGLHELTTIQDPPPAWNLTVNETGPVFFYCTAPNSCIGNQMVGVINPNATQNLATQKAFAANSSYKLDPGQPFPNEGAAPTTLPPSSTSTSPTTSATAAPTTSEASSGSTSTTGGLGTGGIVAIVVCVVAAIVAFFLIRYLLVRRILRRRATGKHGLIGVDAAAGGASGSAGESKQPLCAPQQTTTTEIQPHHPGQEMSSTGGPPATAPALGSRTRRHDSFHTSAGLPSPMSVSAAFDHNHQSSTSTTRAPPHHSYAPSVATAAGINTNIAGFSSPVPQQNPWASPIQEAPDSPPPFPHSQQSQQQHHILDGFSKPVGLQSHTPRDVQPMPRAADGPMELQAHVPSHSRGAAGAAAAAADHGSYPRPSEDEEPMELDGQETRRSEWR